MYEKRWRRRRRGQPLCVCFAYLRQICCLVSSTEGSPLTNWGCFWKIQTRVCNTQGQLLGVYMLRDLSLQCRNESQSLFLRFLSLRPPSRLSLPLRAALVKLGRLFPTVRHWLFRGRRGKAPYFWTPGSSGWLFISDATERPTLCGIPFMGEFTADDRFRVARDTYAPFLRGITYISNISVR